jgi:hypothetical protein
LMLLRAALASSSSSRSGTLLSALALLPPLVAAAASRLLQLLRLGQRWKQPLALQESCSSSSNAFVQLTWQVLQAAICPQRQQQQQMFGTCDICLLLVTLCLAAGTIAAAVTKKC